MLDWKRVAGRLMRLAKHADLWRSYQDKSLEWIANGLLRERGLLIADEVGMGKTRLAVAVAAAVVAEKGRVAVLVPPGVTHQWERDEIPKFYQAVSTIDPALGLQPRIAELRTYDGLFWPDSEQREVTGEVYPLTARSPVVLISHRFGIPQKLQDSSRAERWALPIKVKALATQRSSLRYDGKRFYGLKKANLPEGQIEAARWLASQVDNPALQGFWRDLAKLDLRLARGAKSMLEPAERKVFHRMMGELIGPVDLIIVDEAHKSRLGADAGAEATLRSRLSACINEILAPCCVDHLGAPKRLALTATPLELDAGQWEDILSRLDLERTRLARLTESARAFAEVVRSTTWCANLDPTDIGAPAQRFQSLFDKLVTRRRWKDHPRITTFSSLQGAQSADAAHPHRRWKPIDVGIDGLSPDERLAAAAAESMALTARGSDLSMAVKTLGARHSQGLPIPSEDASDLDSSEANADLPAPDFPSSAKQQRHDYWRRVYQAALSGTGSLAEKPEWYLQRHPRVRATFELIEKLSEGDAKVLVFGTFLAPMNALGRALNIRRFMSDLLARRPTILPPGYRESDPDLRWWLTQPEFSSLKGKFAARARQGRRDYETRRDQIREKCEQAVRRFPGSHDLSKSQREGLRTWLQQSLSEISPDRDASFDYVQAATGLLQATRDADPALKGAPDGSGNERENSHMRVKAADLGDEDPELRARWTSLVDEIIRDELRPKGEGGPAFRRSAFARVLSGDTATPTRRVLQTLFNNPRLRPQVLIAQSAVASEGLNLHAACRCVVLFHLDWNPGRIEQQVGRVDREDSLWMKSFESYLGGCREGGTPGTVPFIDIYTISLAGTYDAFRTSIVKRRLDVLRSQLFGELAPPEQLDRLPASVRSELGRMAPDFSPGRCMPPRPSTGD